MIPWQNHVLSFYLLLNAMLYIFFFAYHSTQVFFHSYIDLLIVPKITDIFSSRKISISNLNILYPPQKIDVLLGAELFIKFLTDKLHFSESLSMQVSSFGL